MEQGPAIRQARNDLNMTQAHLAALSGVSEKTVRRAEAGDAIRPDSIRALCAALKLDATVLRSRGQEEPDDTLWRDALASRQIWASRVAIVCLVSGCVLGPTARYVYTSPWGLQFRMATLFACLATLVATYGFGIACLLVPPLRRRFMASAVTRWLGARREQAIIASMIWVFTTCLCFLPTVLHSLMLRPVPVNMVSLGACVAVMAFSGAVVAWLVTLKDIALPPRTSDWAGVGIRATDAGPLEGFGRFLRPSALGSEANPVAEIATAR